jgi:uncharacterized protein YbgA (DUF1722 family)
MTWVDRAPQAERHACGRSPHEAAIDREPRLRLGVSACLLGKPVRFDGGHERDTFLTDRLARFVEWVPVLPEEEAGLGTPREAMRLCVRVQPSAALNLDGFVLKKDSPSCGLPMLPVEEEGRLCDPVLRENFIERVYAFRRVRRLLEDRTRVGKLVQFHTEHKLQLLAHSPAQYTALGRFVAHARAMAPERVMVDYGRAFTTALTAIATRARHVNVLQHAAGHFRRVLSAAACGDVAAAIVDYQRGLSPLAVPLRLIEHYARLHDVRYLCNQRYLNPYPRELMLTVVRQARRAP